MSDQYRVTNGTIIVRGHGEVRRGFIFTSDDKVYGALGKKEVDRLVRQGWLRHTNQVIGRDGPATVTPAHKPIPAVVDFDRNDYAAANPGRAEFGHGRTSPPEVRGAEHPEVDAGLEPHGEDIDREAAKAEIEADRAARAAAQPGALKGRWLLSPEQVAGMTIAQLNAAVQDIDDSTPLFEAGEEKDARRLLTSDYREPREEAKPSAGGDAAVSKADRSIVG
jgi:hypothetical protein